MPTPSLLIVPARWKTGSPGKLYSQIPTDGSGDFNVTGVITGGTNAGTRVNNLGYIEAVTTSGTPRLDYYTSSGTPGCPALLVEPSAANGILNSTDTTTSWTLGANLTSGAIDVIGVSGNNLTVSVSGSNLNDSNGRLQRASNNVSLASGSTYTLSFLMKKTGAHTIGGYVLVIDSGGNKVLGGNFDVSGSFSSGITTTTAPVDNRIRRVEQWGTNVYRCSETFRMTASGTVGSLRLGPVVSTTSVENSAVGTELGFAAPQLELGSVPTSFIPTTTAAVTRNADVISVSGAVSGAIGQTEGTIYAEVTFAGGLTSRPTTRQIMNISDGTDNNRVAIYIADNTTIIFGFITANGSNLLNNGASFAGVASAKIAIAYKSADYAIYVNGVVAASGTTAFSFATTLNQVTIGSRHNLINQLNDRIRAAALYTTRLTNAQLAALTSP